MDQVTRPVRAAEAEEIVRRVKGVSEARVDVGRDGGIERVHVLGTAERTPRVVAGDVIAALAAELGVSVQPAQVRVATLRGERAEAVVPPVRLKFVGLVVSRLRSAAEVRVQLEHNGLMYEGAASGPSTASHLLKIVGQAALRAVETYLRADAVCALEAAIVAPAASRQVAVVLISWLAPEEALLCGASLVHDDPREAVVRAVLDALNRPLAGLGER